MICYHLDFEMFLLCGKHTNSVLPTTSSCVQHRNGSNPAHGRSHAQNVNSGNHKKKTVVICQCFEKSGYSSRTCYKIHGFPNKPRTPTAHVT